MTYLVSRKQDKISEFYISRTQYLRKDVFNSV
mgnify:CR=1 FL=1